MKALQEIQARLEAPKSQYNKFGNYSYRSCEDILAAVKPLLTAHNAVLTISDDIILKGDRYYVQATVTLTADSEAVTCTAIAREAEVKKGMDAAQITGAASSYARKYALNGLFAIDDTKDADTMKPVTDHLVEPVKPISKDQAMELETRVADTESDVAAFLKFAGAETFEEIPLSALNKCRSALAAKEKK